MDKRVKEAADYLRERAGECEIGLILGSGLASALTPENAVTIDYHDIPNFPIPTVPGHMGEWVSGTLGKKKVAMMRGRFHLYEGCDPDNLIFPVRVMKLLGVKTLILTNAAGGVNPTFAPGNLMLISDHINFGGKNPLIGLNDTDFGVRFPDMTEAYDKNLRETTKKVAVTLGIDLKEGVYMWFSGPSYETPAEIRMARVLGADAVGMSTVPEVIAARHAGMRVLGISCITNLAAGLGGEPLSHKEVVATGERVRETLSELLTKTMETL